MSPNYKPQNPAHRRLPPRNTTWPEQQANLILGLRDMCGVACNTPDSVVEEFDADRQIHARWTDPDLVSALVGSVSLVFDGGLDVNFRMMGGVFG